MSYCAGHKLLRYLTTNVVKSNTNGLLRATISSHAHCCSQFGSNSFWLTSSIVHGFDLDFDGVHSFSGRQWRCFHSSFPLLKKRKNKRAALANHDAKMEEIAHREVQEARKVAKAGGTHISNVDEIFETNNNDDIDDSLDVEEEEGEDFVSLPTKTEVRKKMQRVIDGMSRAFKSIRGNQISAEIFECIMVEAYGGVKTPLTSLAQVVVASPTRVVMSPYDPSVANALRDAVRDSPDLNFNPLVENGEVIVPIPKVSQETRMQLSKQVGKMAEESRKRVRRIRKTFQDKVKRGKEAGFSEDEVFRCSKEVDFVTDEVISLLNDVADKKQESIMKV